MQQQKFVPRKILFSSYLKCNQSQNFLDWIYVYYLELRGGIFFSKKLEKVCKEDQEDEDIGYGRQLKTDQDIICTTYYQSECVTRDEEHQVSQWVCNHRLSG